MDWRASYMEALNRFGSNHPLPRGVGVAFNTNIDGIIHLDGQRIQGLMSQNREISDQAFHNRSQAPDQIKNPVDVMIALLNLLERGAGGEYMVHDRDIYQWLVSSLGIDRFRMGGNAGIMANALSRLGAGFVIPHAVQLPRKQAELFLDEDNILLPVPVDGDVSFAHPAQAARDDEQLVHLILEFKEGTRIRWDGEELQCPRNNRLIINADQYNGRVAVDPAFVKGVERKVRDMDKFILTGLHMLNREYPDGSTHVDRLEEALGYIENWRGMNPDLKVHFELADIRDEAIRGEVLKRTSRISDSIGMNEDELSMILGREDLLAGPASILEAMMDFQSTYGFAKTMLHSKDFVVSLVSEYYGVSPSAVADAQMVGIASSQNRANSGEFGSVEDLVNLVSSSRLALSRAGEELYRRFSDLGDPVREGIWKLDGGPIHVVMTPCLLSKKTRNTVGLGDCLTAGCVISEIER